ncbi:FAS1-like dehydratase domain-containing protein [Streptomyces plumbiresistens]|uniref:MaoC family dehydratase N-terminal domain-containing protein n=1 Tax=Streptomyces plumbiresistens TaxID=511811 RepID=A0ABP7TEJ2_9ACTN
MAIDPAVIGTRLPQCRMTVDPARLRFFRKAVGADAGDDGTVPPTFLFSVELESPDPFGWLRDLGIDLRRVLHGEQSFMYHRPLAIGERLTASPVIADVYSRGEGALDFVVKETAVTRGDGEPVADLRSVLIVRNPT